MTKTAITEDIPIRHSGGNHKVPVQDLGDQKNIKDAVDEQGQKQTGKKV